jgi:molybdenum cofactor cytidylyltransferase
MGHPKLLLPWGDTTVLGAIHGQWIRAGAAQISLVCSPHHPDLRQRAARLGIPEENLIENPEPARGMFSSIQCAAQWNGWKPGLTHWVVALGDQPHLRQRTIEALLEFSQSNPSVVCQPSFEGRPCHPVVLPGQVFAELRDSGATTLREFLAGRSRKMCSIPDPGLAIDLDTPEDYEAALKSMR